MLELSRNESISQESRQVFKRRFIVMVKHWISALDKNRNELLVLLLQQLESASDIAVIFTVIECLNQLVRTDYNCELNYEVLLNASIGAIGSLLTHMTSPNYIWEVSRYLGNLLKNCGDQMNFNILQTLNHLDLAGIIGRNPTLMKSVFADIFSIILRSTPNPSFIFHASMNYLNISLQTITSEDTERTLKFWLELLRQTDASRSAEDRQVIEALFALFKQKFDRLLRYMDQDENLAAMMTLVEELILADFQFEKFTDFLKSFYALCRRDNEGSFVRLKNDFFSVMSSHLLRAQSKEQAHLIPFDFYMSSLFQEMNAEVSDQVKKSETRLKNQVMALFGRLLFINTEAVFNFLGGTSLTQANLLDLLKVT